MIITLDMVERELKSQATAEELDALDADINTWAELLAEIHRNLGAQFTKRKADSLACGVGNHRAITEYNVWKAGAVRYSQHVVNRLRELKSAIKERNKEMTADVSSTSNHAVILKAILAELKTVREILERK